MPRSMLAPWSASPMAESSSVSRSLCSATSAWKARIHRTTSAAVASNPLRPPAQAGGLHRGVPEPGQVVVHLQERDGAAGHLERRDVRTDQVAGDGDAPIGQEAVELAVHDVELDQGGAAHP